MHNFIIHEKTATCFGYTYVAIIRLDIEPRIRKVQITINLVCNILLYCILMFSYSRFCIHPDDGYIFIAETCSYFSSSLVFSPKAGYGRNQNPVRRPVWLWHTAF